MVVVESSWAFHELVLERRGLAVAVRVVLLWLAAGTAFIPAIHRTFPPFFSSFRMHDIPNHSASHAFLKFLCAVH